MIGGNPVAYQVIKPALDAISVEGGSLYTGPSGSGILPRWFIMALNMA